MILHEFSRMNVNRDMMKFLAPMSPAPGKPGPQHLLFFIRVH